MAWMHVPGLSEPSPSAPESEGLTSASLPHSPTCACGLSLVATSNGKPSAKPCWWPGWRKRPWSRLLSGTTCSPSLSSCFAELWIWWWRGSPASPTPPPGSAEVPMMSGTFGPSPESCSAGSTLGLSSSRTSAGSPRGPPPTSCGSPPTSGTTAGAPGSAISRPRAFYRRLRWVRPTNAIESSCWPTVAASDSRASGRASTLSDPANRMKPGVSLTDALHQWASASASASDWKGSSRPGQRRRQLPDQLHAWYPTSKAEAYGSSQNGINSTRPSAGTPSLETMARTGLLPSSLPAQEREPSGEKSSSAGLVLNPLFVEWLMGLLPGWIDFEPLGTAWFHYRRRLRSSLSGIVTGWPDPDVERFCS